MCIRDRSGSVTNSKSIKNGLCGIVAMGEGVLVNLNANTCSSNRGAGILLSGRANATVAANTCEKNLLSGIVARGIMTKVALNKNITNANLEAGILTHHGVTVSEFENNLAESNGSKQIWRDALLSTNQNAN